MLGGMVLERPETGGEDFTGTLEGGPLGGGGTLRGFGRDPDGGVGRCG
ncbi:Hypothetical protein CAP_4591 [Chondromyces apiculatus DSM 436]|uniref:Uncharacterized protein n=1 Tax=Chondromyces apiculatus DSM 436 TaxID=1192034 RepID=A0A017T5M8_9BACT|nr:Hypothetical protein CAP_4591 [Chondromyces apiculatus DSM 436]